MEKESELEKQAKLQDFGRRLKQARLSQGWSQTKFADQLGVNSKTIQRWEDGKHAPTPYAYTKLCRVLNKSEEELGLSVEYINNVLLPKVTSRAAKIRAQEFAVHELQPEVASPALEADTPELQEPSSSEPSSSSTGREGEASSERQPDQSTRSLKERISRRALLAGLVVAGGGAVCGLTWLIRSRSTGTSSDLGSSTEVVFPHTGVWTRTHRLFYPRSFFSATSLKSGEILVAGGDTPYNGWWAECEIFNFAENSWRQTKGNLHYPRREHLAFLLPTEEVLVFGGYAGDPPLLATELYDPRLDTWSLSGKLTQSRTRIAAIQWKKGKYAGMVLVMGGWFGETIYYPTTELYDFTKRTWSRVGNMVYPRFNHVAVVLNDGRVLVAGGTSGSPSMDSKYISEAELYDPATDTWSVTGSMNFPREVFTATTLPNGKVLALGGMHNNRWTQTAELYDPEKGTWAEIRSMQHERNSFHGPSTVVQKDGTILVVGGDLSGTSEVYDPHSARWGSLINMGSPHCGAAIAQLTDGRVLVAGGYDGVNFNNIFSSVAIYAPH